MAVRLRRARVLTRLDPPAPEFDIVLDEAALRRIAEASELPNVSVRILPFGAGLPHTTLANGSFTAMDFPARHEPTTIYIEGITGALFLDKPAESTRYASAFHKLRSAALDSAASRDLLLTTAKDADPTARGSVLRLRTTPDETGHR